jgi:hypothetical protein
MLTFARSSGRTRSINLLATCTDVVVQEFDDIKSGYKISFVGPRTTHLAAPFVLTLLSSFFSANKPKIKIKTRTEI